MKTNLLRIPVESFRRIESPYDVQGTKSYLVVVNIKNLPKELEDWKTVNVRDAKLSSNVSRTLLVSSIAMMLFSQSVVAKEAVGTVVAMDGAAYAVDSNGKSRPLQKGAPVYSGDQVVTKNNTNLRVTRCNT